MDFSIELSTFSRGDSILYIPKDIKIFKSNYIKKSEKISVGLYLIWSTANEPFNDRFFVV